jgi:adenosylcobinamide-GDP ribazoletransferase
MKSFLLMLTYITRIPYPIKFEFDEKEFVKGLHFMPFIGLLVGFPLAGLGYLLGGIDPLIRGFVLLIVYILLVGGLHIDGLSDYSDGIFSGQKKERMFEIMSDSHTGTFGVVGVGLYLIGMTIGLSQGSWEVILLMPFIGRSCGLLAIALGRYPKEKGMGMALIAYGKPIHGLIALVPLSLIIFLLFPGGFLVYIAGGMTLIIMLLFIARTTQILGGITGDVIGAVIEISQVIWLILMAITGGMV